VAKGHSSLLLLQLLLLFPRQNEELGVGCQHLANGLLELSPGLDSASYLFDPLLGDVLDVLFPLHHKGQRPDWMAAVVDAMTSGFAAAEMSEGERAGEGILGNKETAQQFELTLTQSRSEWVSCSEHLNVRLP
jgi:hypothetical protein